MTEQIMVHAWHCRKLKLCRQGVQDFCSAHGVSYSALLKSGIPVEEVDKIDDVFAKRVADLARGRS